MTSDATDPCITDIIEAHCDDAKSVWIVGPRMNVVCAALDDIGIDSFSVTCIDDDSDWNQRCDSVNWHQAAKMADECKEAPDWLVVTNGQDAALCDLELKGALEVLAWKGLSSVLFFHNVLNSPSPHRCKASWQ